MLLIRPETTKALATKDLKQPVFDKDLERGAVLGRQRDFDCELSKGREKEKAAKGVFGCFQGLFKKSFKNG